MHKNIKLFLLCPVPDDQKPINEYIGLKKNPLTCWTTISQINYQKKIRKGLFLASLIYGLFTINNIFIDFNNLFEWFLKDLFVSINFALFLIAIIIFRWKQTQIRFNQTRLVYEEGSWYDSQVWEKPFLIIKNDKLLSTQKIEPILQRLKQTLLLLFCLDFICLILFQI